MLVCPQSELTDWLLDDRRPEGCRLESFEPLLNWVILIDGPETPPYLYRGQTFRCSTLWPRVSLMCPADVWVFRTVEPPWNCI